MKVQDLYDLMSRGKTVMIKPGGRRIYFEGSCNDIPECMMQLPVMEIEPIATHTGSAICIMVKSTPELNALVDCGVSVQSKAEIDSTFNELIKERTVRENATKSTDTSLPAQEAVAKAIGTEPSSASSDVYNFITDNN